MSWKKLTDFGGRKSYAEESESQGVKMPRRDILKIGWGIAGITASAAVVGGLKVGLAPKSVHVAYKSSLDADAQPLALNGSKGVLTSEQGAKYPDKLIVDGASPDGKPWTIEAPETTQQLYLNQALLKGVSGLKLIRNSTSEDAVYAQHHYILQLLGEKQENGPVGPDNVLGTILFGPHSDNLSNASAGFFAKDDFFPDVHFFNSRGLPTKVPNEHGELEEFVLQGKEIVRTLPQAELETDKDGNPKIQSQIEYRDELMVPYANERLAYEARMAEKKKNGIQLVSNEVDHFETKLNPPPLSSQANGILLGMIAKHAGAKNLGEKYQGAER